MACNKPLLGFQSYEKKANGKRIVAFSPDGGTHPIALPCGRCMGCRLDRARSWALRLQLESLSHKTSCFLTLTYDEDHIPEHDSLNPTDLQRFIKRLRKRISPINIRHYCVGEYGGKFERPHYHAIIFGYDFPDRRVYLDRPAGRIDNSTILTELWPFGHATVQDAGIGSFAYVSKYAVKKITGEKAKQWYEWVDDQTGEVHQRIPEFARMSRRPGIGADWLQKYYKDLYPKGYVTNGKGVKFPPPEYFNKLYERWFPEQMEELRNERREEVFKRYNEANIERMEAREKIQRAQFNLKKGGKS